MNDVAIHVENIKKSFNIHHEKEGSIFEYLTSILDKKTNEELTVLDDISFTIKKGEMLGIIGLNGSGKSTLLKILTGIYTPDSGKFTVFGKMTSFLALGTGFQPEFTAKDNVIIYGVLLGFTKKEILSKMDSIIEFAGLEKFADTKLKIFSSGMQARLAFSTAMQVNPDILIVDEVLAVGDLPFQQKSYDAFLKFKQNKKSIIFVSHDLASVEKLCDVVLFLHKGKVRAMGEPSKVIEEYTKVVSS